MESGMSDPQVIVIGAGPAGLCLARALSLRGLRVDVVEQQPAGALEAPPPDGREIALTHASMRILRDLGVWARLPDGGIARWCGRGWRTATTAAASKWTGPGRGARRWAPWWPTATSAPPPGRWR